MVENIAIVGFGTLMAAGVQIMSMRKREKSRAAELLAARKIIDELTNEAWLILSNVDQAFHSSLDSRESLAAVTRALIPAFADLCVIDLLTEDQQQIERIRAHEGQIHSVNFSPKNHPVGKAISEAKAELINELSESSLFLLEDEKNPLPLLKALGIKSLISAPLISKRGPLGVITFGLTRSGRRFSRIDLDCARQIAARAALAIENSRLYQREQVAVQARDRLLSVVAHELKTPLTSIVLGSDPRLKQSYESRMQKIHSASWRIERIVNDLLNAEKFDRGALTLNLKPEDFKLILAELHEQMSPIAQVKKIEISHAVPENCPKANVDYGRMLQAISNVVGNAIKFTPEGGQIKIDVQVYEHQFKISIQDSGPGMSEEVASNAFNLYWQAKNTAHLGSGLGLYLTKSIVELHGGTVEIQSSPGNGTTVYLKIPQTI